MNEKVKKIIFQEKYLIIFNKERVEMIIKNGVSVIRYKNEELNRITEMILQLSNNMRRVDLFRIATCFRLVREKELYREDGFKSVVDYANKVFGYHKSSVSKMIRVADNYLKRDGSGSIFIYKDGRDFSISQLIEFLSLPKSEIIELVESGKIHPSMTAKDIRVTVGAKKVMNNSVEYFFRYGRF